MQMSSGIILPIWQAYQAYLQRRSDEAMLIRYNAGYMSVLRDYFLLQHPLDYIESNATSDDLFDTGVEAAVIDLREQLKDPFDTGNGD